jgi:hypothetical protein
MHVAIVNGEVLGETLMLTMSLAHLLAPDR